MFVLMFVHKMLWTALRVLALACMALAVRDRQAGPAPAAPCAVLRLRGGAGAQRGGPGMPFFGAGQAKEPEDSEEEWQALRRYASSHGMPVPPEDRHSLPPINKEDAEAIFSGGGGAGLDDPKLRYLFSNLPNFGRPPLADMEQLTPGTIILVTPEQPKTPTASFISGPSATGGAIGGNVDGTGAEAVAAEAAYHAEVVDLAMFLATETPCDPRALEYKYVAHLQRFDNQERPPPKSVAVEGGEEGGVGMGRLTERGVVDRVNARIEDTYGQRQFVRRFYPHIDDDIIDFFDTSSNSILWLVALARDPSGEPLLQNVPRAWARALSAEELDQLRRKGD
jgi:hypothetical protein